MKITADAAATDWNAVAVDYNHYPSTQYANSGPYGTSIGATYEYSGVNDHRPESPGEDKVMSRINCFLLLISTVILIHTGCLFHVITANAA